MAWDVRRHPVTHDGDSPLEEMGKTACRDSWWGWWNTKRRSRWRDDSPLLARRRPGPEREGHASMTALRARAAVLAGWRLILASMLLVALGAFASSFAQRPVYSARTEVLVNLAATDYNVIVQLPVYVHTYVVLCTSAPVLVEVAGHFPGVTASQLTGNVTASVVQNSQLFEIDVQDSSPQRAAAIANDVAAVVIARQQAEMAQEQAQAEQGVMASIATTQDAITSTSSQLAALNATANPDPQQVDALQTRLDSLRTQYANQQQSLAAIQLSKAESEALVEVIDPATPPTTLLRPNRPLEAAIGLLAGLALGVLVVIGRAWRDQRVQGAEAVGRALDCPVLAEIAIRDGETMAERVADGMRRVARQVAFLDVERPLRSLTVTSAHAGEAASEVAALLAVTLAQNGQSTLVVDADLAHPTLGERFGILEERGLSDAALDAKGGATAEQIRARSIFASVAPVLETLYVAPAGTIPPNPSALVRSGAMGVALDALIDGGRAMALVVAPPMVGEGAALLPNGASALAARTDGVVVVVELTRAREGALLRAKASLEDAGGRLVGCIVFTSEERSARRTPSGDEVAKRPQLATAGTSAHAARATRA